MKKLIATIFTLTIVFTLNIQTAATGTDGQGKYMDYANKLKEINVFVGTEDGFELNREPTRIEGLILFLRLLGKEKEALNSSFSHPFDDVPAWADKYVGYAYHEGLSTGISRTIFGSGDKIDAKSYVTFILRALGYDDSKGDFNWSTALEFAREKQVIDDATYKELIKEVFLRDHVAKVSYIALQKNIKNGTATLAQKLVDEGSLDRDQAIEIGVLPADSPYFTVNSYSLSQIPGAAFSCYTKKDNELYALHDRETQHLYYYNQHLKEWERVSDVTGYGWRAIDAIDGKVYGASQQGIYDESCNNIIPIDVRGSAVRLDIAGFLATEDGFYISFINDEADGSGGNPYLGVLYADRNTKKWETFNSGLPEGTCIYKIRVADDGSLWCCGNNGIFYLENTAWHMLAGSDRLQKEFFYTDMGFVYDESGKVSEVYGGCRDHVTHHILSTGKYEDIALPAGTNDTTGIDIDNVYRRMFLGTWWSGGQLYDLDNMDKPLFCLPGSTIGGVFLNDEVLMLGSDGYYGCYRFDVNGENPVLATRGLHSYVGIFSAIVEDGVVKGPITSGLLRYDTNASVWEVNRCRVLGEMHEIKKVNGHYYIHNYDLGLWQIENDFRNIKLIPFNNIDENSEWLGGSSFYIYPDESKVLLFTNKNGSGFYCYDMKTDKLLYKGKGLSPIQYGSRAFMDAWKKPDGDTVVAIRYLNKWNEPLKLYISQDSGRTFELVSESNGEMTNFSGHLLFTEENGQLACRDIETGERVVVPFISANEYQRFLGISGRWLAAFKDNTIDIIDVTTGTVAYRKPVSDTSKYMSTSIVDGNLNILFTDYIVKVDIHDEFDIDGWDISNWERG